MLSQVASLTGLEPYVIQNWVRRGFVAPPERKRYSRRQFSRIVLINMLKDSMQLDKICALLSLCERRAGRRVGRSDRRHPAVPLFCAPVVLVERKNPTGPEEAARWCRAAVEDYQEPVPGARDRVAACLHVIPDGLPGRPAQAEAEALLSALT